MHQPVCLATVLHEAPCTCEQELLRRVEQLERKLADLSRMTLGREVP